MAGSLRRLAHGLTCRRQATTFFEDELYRGSWYVPSGKGLTLPRSYTWTTSRVGPRSAHQSYLYPSPVKKSPRFAKHPRSLNLDSAQQALPSSPALLPCSLCHSLVLGRTISATCSQCVWCSETTLTGRACGSFWPLHHPWFCTQDAVSQVFLSPGTSPLVGESPRQHMV